MGDFPIAEREVVVLLSDLPQHYQTRLFELRSVVKSLFTIEDCGGGGIDSDALTFLEMCHEIFDLDFQSKTCQTHGKSNQMLTNETAATDLPTLVSPAVVVDAATTELLEDFMSKYRSFFRKRYRGFTYLTSTVLQETFQLAYNETRMMYFNKRKNKPTANEKVGIMSLLRRRMLQEFQWVQKINEHKRQMLLDSIKSEVIQEFEMAIRAEFPTAFSKEDTYGFSTGFYEESELVVKVDRMVKSFVEEFKLQVPYDEESEELVKLGMALEAELNNKLIHDLIENNSRHKKNAQSFMEQLVDHSTSIYRDRLVRFITEGPLIEPDQILNCHHALQMEFVQKFKCEESHFPNKSQYLQFLNLLNESIHGTLKGVLAHCSKNGALILTECGKKSKVELDKCMRRIARIFGEYGLGQHFDDLCEKMEADLKDSLNEIRHCSIINAEKMEEALETAKLPLFTEVIKSE